jgi:ABC-type proline/glycine betaine transport system permease subunit
LFPVVLSSMTFILHPRIGGPATAAVIANGGWGMMGFGGGIAVLNLTAVPLGSVAALSLALATCVVWNLMLWWLGRRRTASPSLRA